MIWLYNARILAILAILAVIFVHISAEVVVGNDVGTLYWWIGNAYDSSVGWCIPIFVMLSGALLLNPDKKESLPTFFQKRLSKIFFPLVFWSLFFIFWFPSENGNTFVVILKRLLSGKPYYHMWFLYMIVGLYLFTPFFRKIVLHSTKKELIYLVSSTFFIAILNFAFQTFYLGEGSKLFINWFLLYIPFYFLGYLVYQDQKKHSIILLWSIFVVTILSTLFAFYFFAQIDFKYAMYFYGNLSVLVILMSISLMYILKSFEKPIINEKITKKLAIYSLGIYLVHPILIHPVKDYLLEINPLYGIPLFSTLIFLGSLFIVWVVNQIPYLRRVV